MWLLPWPSSVTQPISKLYRPTSTHVVLFASYVGSQHIKPDFESSDLRCAVFKSSVLNNRYLWSQMTKCWCLQILKSLVFSLNNPSNLTNLQSSGKEAGSPLCHLILTHTILFTTYILLFSRYTILLLAPVSSYFHPICHPIYNHIMIVLLP